MDGRYDNIPLSEQTRKGMTLTIDDLAAIGRLLSLQDNVYEEEFKRLNKRLDSIERKQESILKTLKDHEVRIKCLEEKVQRLIA
jgi:ParB-like chromosome segregation protein Spo0J